MKAWIIAFDNGRDYEDHSVEILCVAFSKKTAEAEKERLTKWLESKQRLLPSIDFDLDDDIWMKQEKERQTFLDKLTLPFGAKCLQYAVIDNCGYVFSYEIKTKK